MRLARSDRSSEQTLLLHGYDPYWQTTVAPVINSQIVDKLKIIIEKHPDGYVSYPLGLKGVVVGEGDTYDEALLNVESAIKFHIETFGEDAFDTESPVLEAYVENARLAA